MKISLDELKELIESGPEAAHATLKFLMAREGKAEEIRRKDRERKRNSVGNPMEIPPSVPPSSSPPITPLLTTPSSPPSSAKADEHKRARGSRLPDNWHPSENLWQLAKHKLALTDEVLRFETAAFRDYWHASTHNAAKLDWDAAWRNWMREAVRRRGTRGNGRAPPPQELTRTRVVRDLLEEAKKRDAKPSRDSH